MPYEPGTFVICFWSDLCESGLAVPGDAERLTKHSMFQRVCRVIGQEERFVLIAYGDLTFAVSPACLRQVEGVRHEVGDPVLFKYGLARIRDIIWHFKDERANYYLEQDGRKLSKRYFNEDLSPAPQLNE